MFKHNSKAALALKNSSGKGNQAGIFCVPFVTGLCESFHGLSGMLCECRVRCGLEGTAVLKWAKHLCACCSSTGEWPLEAIRVWVCLSAGMRLSCCESAQTAEDCELLVFTGSGLWVHSLSSGNELRAPLRVLYSCYCLQLRPGFPSLCFHFITYYNPEQLKRFGLMQMNPFQTLSFLDSFKCQSVLSWWINEAYYRLC